MRNYIIMSVLLSISYLSICDLTQRVAGALPMIVQPAASIHPSVFHSLCDWGESRHVHSLTSSSHHFVCFPLLLAPLTVPCNMIFDRPDDLAVLSKTLILALLKWRLWKEDLSNFPWTFTLLLVSLTLMRFQGHGCVRKEKNASSSFLVSLYVWSNSYFVWYGCWQVWGKLPYGK